LDGGYRHNPRQGEGTILTKLQIRNFRKHKRLDVPLSRITTIRGASGAGKSALIGAFKWLALNQPAGDGFINWEARQAAIRLHVDGHDIRRKRGPTDNKYQLDGKTFKAFGPNVPAPIIDILNINHLNFQQQHIGPFWFRETAGEVSRQLNTIINLDLIDSTLANLGKRQRQAQYQIKDTQQRISTATQQKASLRFILILDKKLIALEDQQTQLVEDNHTINVLSGLIEQGKLYEIASSQTIPNIQPLLTLHEQWKVQQTSYKRLNQLYEQAKDYEESFIQLGNNIDKDEQKLKHMLGKQCPLCGSILGKAK